MCVCVCVSVIMIIHSVFLPRRDWSEEDNETLKELHQELSGSLDLEILVCSFIYIILRKTSVSQYESI